MLVLGMPAMLGYVATTLYLEGLGRPLAGVGGHRHRQPGQLALNWLLILAARAIRCRRGCRCRPRHDGRSLGDVGVARRLRAAGAIDPRPFGPPDRLAPALVAAGQAAAPGAAVRGLAGPRDQRLPGPDADLRLARAPPRWLPTRSRSTSRPWCSWRRWGSPRRPRSASAAGIGAGNPGQARAAAWLGVVRHLARDARCWRR